MELADELSDLEACCGKGAKSRGRSLTQASDPLRPRQAGATSESADSRTICILGPSQAATERSSRRREATSPPSSCLKARRGTMESIARHERQAVRARRIASTVQARHQAWTCHIRDSGRLLAATARSSFDSVEHRRTKPGLVTVAGKPGDDVAPRRCQAGWLEAMKYLIVIEQTKMDLRPAQPTLVARLRRRRFNSSRLAT